MAIVQILRNTYSLGATITSTNEEAGAPARFMGTYRHSQRWKTNNLTAMRAIIDAGSAKPWDTIFLGYSNVTDAGTLRITSGTATGTLFSSPGFDSTAFDYRYPYVGEFIAWHAWYEAPATQTFQYIGIEIVDAANPDGFITVGIAYAGSLFTPSLQAEMGDDWNYDDTSVVSEMVNGESVSRRRRRVARGSVSWEDVSEIDGETFKGISRTYGKSTPMVVKVTPGIAAYGHNNLHFCRVTDYRGPSRTADYGHNADNPLDPVAGPRFNVGIAIREV